MISSQEILARPFATISALLAAHARERRNTRALVGNEAMLTYGELDKFTGRIAAVLRQDWAAQGQPVAIVSANSVACAVVFLRSADADRPIFDPGPSCCNDRRQRRFDGLRRRGSSDRDAACLPT